MNKKPINILSEQNKTNTECYSHCSDTNLSQFNFIMIIIPACKNFVSFELHLSINFFGFSFTKRKKQNKQNIPILTEN